MSWAPKSFSKPSRCSKQQWGLGRRPLCHAPIQMAEYCGPAWVDWPNRGHSLSMNIWKLHVDVGSNVQWWSYLIYLIFVFCDRIQWNWNNEKTVFDLNFWHYSESWKSWSEIKQCKNWAIVCKGCSPRKAMSRMSLHTYDPNIFSTFNRFSVLVDNSTENKEER